MQTWLSPSFRGYAQAQPLPAGLQAQAGPHAQPLGVPAGVAADTAAWQPHWQPAPGQFVQLQRSFIWVFMVSSFQGLVSRWRTKMSDTRSVFAPGAAHLNETADLRRGGKRRGVFVALVVVTTLCAAQPPVPPGLAELIAKAPIAGPVAAWCAARIARTGPVAYAIAVPAQGGGGRYVVLAPEGGTAVLGNYSGEPDLSCLTPAEARRLNRSIAQTPTIHGAIQPLRDTTVVCGFVENTRAVCWQHSPKAGTFVRVGEWTT